MGGKDRSYLSFVRCPLLIVVIVVRPLFTAVVVSSTHIPTHNLHTQTQHLNLIVVVVVKCQVSSVKYRLDPQNQTKQTIHLTLYPFYPISVFSVPFSLISDQFPNLFILFFFENRQFLKKCKSKWWTFRIQNRRKNLKF